jgi:hypothetical protein
MHFWSEGLGDSELVMGLGRAKLDRKGEFVVLTGVVDSPAPWEYEVRVQFDDWIAILKTATSKEACDFIARHMSVAALAGMSWSIVKFVALLAAYRCIRVMGLAPATLSPLNSLERNRTEQSKT